MNLKVTLSLLVVLAVAIGALILTGVGGDETRSTHPTPAPNNPSDSIKLLRDADLGMDLKSITISRGLQGDYVLERQAGRWRVTHPQRFPANIQAVNEILTVLDELKGTPSEQSFGPVPDQSVLVLHYPDREIALLIGKRLGGGKAGIHVSSDTRQNYIIPDALANLFDYFDDRLIYATSLDAPLMPDTRRIEITVDDKTTTFEQQDGQWWILHGGHRERALPRTLGKHLGISAYFYLFDNVKIIEHVGSGKSLNLAAYGLEKPLITTRLTPMDDSGSVHVLRIGVPANIADPTRLARYASFADADDRNPVVFAIDEDFALSFAQAAEAFRDPRLILTPSSLIESIVVEVDSDHTHRFNILPDGSAELIRNNDPPITLARPTGVALCTALYDSRAITFVDDPAPDLEPVCTIHLTARLGGKGESLAIYADPQSADSKPTVLVRRAGEQVLLRVDRSMIEALIEPDRLLTPP